MHECPHPLSKMNAQPKSARPNWTLTGWTSDYEMPHRTTDRGEKANARQGSSSGPSFRPTPRGRKHAPPTAFACQWEAELRT